MKIAFIVSKFPVLSLTAILNQITGLLDLGQDVEVFAQLNPEEGKVHQDVETYRLMERVHYFNMPSNKLQRVLKAFYLLIANFHKAPGAIFRSLNVFKCGKEALSLRIFYILLPFIGKESTYDIIHCHFGPNGILGVLLKELGIKGKIVTTFHAYDITAFIVSKGKNVYNELFAKGDLFMPISNHWRKRLIELGCNKDKTVVHRAGIDSEKFRSQERRPHKNNIINILTVGRLVEKKGIEYAIQAEASITHKYPNLDTKYRIGGDGPLKTKLKALISELNAEEQIKLLGILRDDEVKSLMMQSDIFLLPSVTSQEGDQEGIPAVLMEALATGMPVISTYHSGIPELVADGKSGFLVPERDVDALVEKLGYLVEHPELWSKMGRFGREFVEKHYDIKKLNQRLVEIYQNLVQEKIQKVK